MRFRAYHETRFRYSSAVYLEPHTLRLRPRSDSWQRLERFEVDVDPEPVRLAEAVDAEGNDIMHAWFSGQTESLTIRSEFQVQTLRDNPYDYLVLNGSILDLPVQYPKELRAHLAPALRRTQPGDPSVAEFARDIARQAQGATPQFLSGLSAAIARTHEVAVRLKGEPEPPAETLRTRSGACRDLAVLFMDCCRAVGMAARFVSGYQERTHGDGDHHMHAWSEVYLPGGGWRGYDPSLGLAVSNRHIAVASSSSSRWAAPIAGTFRGEAVRLPLEVGMRVTRL